MKTLFKLFFAVFSMLFMAAVFSTALDAPVADVLAVMTVFSLVLFAVRVIFFIKNPADYGKRHAGAAYGVAVEFWESVIAEFILKEYSWIRRAKDRTGNVLNGAVIHIPQAGGLPGAVRNRANFPAPIVKRADTDLTYVLDEISTNPTHIRDAEKVELTYDKVASVLSDHIKQQNFLSGFNMLYRWAGKNPTAGGVTPADLPGANIRRTTGTTAATHLTGATGNRKQLLLADFLAAKTIMNNITKRESNPNKRAMLLDETLYNQLVADANLVNDQQYLRVGAQFQNGDLVRLGGYDIIRTDVMPRFNNATTPIAKDPLTDADAGVPYSSTFATTDNACALLIDFDYVHFALGDVKLFETLGDAAYQGDIYSTLVRLAGSRERSDAVGVVAIVQEP
jgi:hypothetical protein